MCGVGRPLAAIFHAHGNGDRLRMLALECLAQPVNKFAQSLHVPSVFHSHDEKHTNNLTELSPLGGKAAKPS